MDRLQFYKYGMLALVLLNLGLIAFLLLGPKPNREGPLKRPQFKERAVNILDLDNDQKAIFQDLAQKHGQEMESINHLYKDLLRAYFSKIDNSNAEVSVSILDSITSLEVKKITLTYEHFKDVKAILNEEQLKKFDKFVNQAMGNILQNTSQRPPPRHH